MLGVDSSCLADILRRQRLFNGGPFVCLRITPVNNIYMKKLLFYLAVPIFLTYPGFALGGEIKLETAERVRVRESPTAKRVYIVARDGSGGYRGIQEAINDSAPGDLIVVKNGTYNGKLDFRISGTAEKPITVKNYPGHSPVLDFAASPDQYPRVEFNAQYIILDGFEIRNGWDGVKVYQPNNTIRNNYIHGNTRQGILIVSTDNIIVEGNKIKDNGVATGQCLFDGVSSPKHCHGVYISDYKCTGADNIVIRGNYISGHGGRGIQWNGQGCASRMDNTVVEGNRIENNSWGLALFYNVWGAVIRNNKFINKVRPNTDDTSWTFMGIWGSQNNTIEGNVFYSTLTDFSPLEVFDSASANNAVNNNVWKSKYPRWKWEDSWRSDWMDYKAVTGWGKDSEICMNCD